MRRSERQNDRVFRTPRLQFEIESAAQSLSQRESPGAIQATAERRMNHDVRAAVFVKETFDDDVLLRWHDSQRDFCQRQVFDYLLRRGLHEADLIDEPVHGRARSVRTGSGSDRIN